MFIAKRNQHNPIIKPNLHNHWEAQATFNWSPIKRDNKTHVFYRAQTKPDFLHGPNLSMSVIGKAVSNDDVHYDDRKPFIVPTEEWEKYGCEDPRATEIDGSTYIFYTALSKYPFDHEGIKVACAVTDDLDNIKFKKLVTPFNAKAMALFPEKINGKYYALLTVHPDRPPASICIAEFESLDNIWSMDFWQKWYSHYKEHEITLNRNDQDHVEIGAVPFKTDRGWVLIYSHIQDYFTDDPIFGIEAVILDLNDPTKIVGRTNYPFLVPETYYEKEGDVKNIAFPSGALVEGDTLRVFYGGADTVCCEFEICLPEMLESIEGDSYREDIERYEGNPILSPKPEHSWEDYAVFNPAAIDLDGKVRILYRAMGTDNTSVMGIATSENGYDIDFRDDKPVYTPRAEFEHKLNAPDGYSGCEDPRLTIVGDQVHLLYTAYDGVNPPKIAASHISVNDFKNNVWNWSEPHLVSPEGIDDKDACVFPQKFDDQYIVIHRMESHMCLDYVDSLDFEHEEIDKCIRIIGPRPGMWDSEKVGLSGPPLKTDHGWLLLYHGVSKEAIYRVGAALLDLENPASVISRTSDYIFEPKMDYELEGQINNVVFPCGSVIRDDKVYLYYGGADSVVGLATLDLQKTLDSLLY